MNLAQKAVRGASVTLAAQVIRIIVQLGSTVALARLLAPSDFGLLAMVLSIIGIGEIVRDFGLSMAAVQAKTLSRDQKSNLFWLNSAVGLSLTVVAYLLSNPIASLYGNEDLAPIVQALCLTFFVNGVATQFRAEINRKLRFVALSVIDTLPQIVGVSVGITLAVMLENYWALVAQQLSVAFSGLILAIWLARWMPGLPNRRGSIQQLVSFGSGVFGTQSLAYITRNADNVALGLAWGPVTLGLYTRAYQLLMFPIYQITAPLSRVAIPILSRVADDHVRFEAYLKKGQIVGGLVAGCVYAVCAGLADPIVRILFGSEWTGLIAIFQALALGGAFRAMNQVTYWAFLGKGKSLVQLRLYLVTQPVIIVAMLAGLPWGAVGVAVGHSVGYALNWIVALYWCGRKLDLNTRSFALSGLQTMITVTIPIFVICLAASAFVPGMMLQLCVGALATVVYLAAAWMLIPPVRRDIETAFDAIQKVRAKS